MGIKETALSLKLQYPKDYVSFSRGFYLTPKPGHHGVDMAWNSNYGGKYPPVYAPADGKVITAAYDKDGYGYYVIIEHVKGVRTLMAHMQSNLLVKKGDKVVRKQRIGTQGSTGNSTGPHVHFEVRLNGERVNPAEYVYCYPDQVVNESTAKQYNLMFYSPVVYVGDPVARNPKVDQVRNDYTNLRARKAPGVSGEVAGYLNVGWYNVTGITEVDGYTWYNVGGYWAADTGAKFEYVPKDPDPIYSVFFPEVNEAQKDNLAKVASALNVKVEIKEK